jgi:hypothetical protein
LTTLRPKQGDQMRLRKNCPDHFWHKSIHNFHRGKKEVQNCGLLVSFSKNFTKKTIAHQAKNRPIWSPWSEERVSRKLIDIGFL